MTAARAVKVVLATGNPHKLTEVRRIVATVRDDIEFIGLAPDDDALDVIEDGETFADNALIKARAAAASTGMPAVADDSGLCVDALNGMPGVLSARWAGRARDDAANLALVLDQMSDVRDSRRGAQFVCAAAYAEPGGRQNVVYGVVHGQLLTEPSGSGGFGYDPIFVPDGHRVTTASMSPQEKDAVSHRGAAFRKLAAQLPSR